MGLNRGFKGLQPCPICHVPKDELHNFGESWPLRTGCETEEILTKVRTLNAKNREENLKANGICPVAVC
jgi:hypothetical protein